MALEVVGWTLLIVRDALFAGTRRCSDFEGGLGLAPNVLASRLEALVEAGVMERPQHGDRSEYHLTDKGRDLCRALVALARWGDRWAAPGEPPILSYMSCAAAT